MWFTRISVKYPVFTVMMMLCLMVLGLASWQRMGVEEFPDVDFPFVVVYTNYPGASPETVESEITKKMEDQINTISGLKQVISQSSEGLSTILDLFFSQELINRECGTSALDTIPQTLAISVE